MEFQNFRPVPLTFQAHLTPGLTRTSPDAPWTSPQCSPQLPWFPCSLEWLSPPHYWKHTHLPGSPPGLLCLPLAERELSQHVHSKGARLHYPSVVWGFVSLSILRGQTIICYILVSTYGARYCSQGSKSTNSHTSIDLMKTHISDLL
ncbi:unnamed protein product [Gulo gulo]|uniref:Uncharacterized protein n=1 Tax=Gulo gulo TaxID=48420 RepID=A0A9X9M9J0_GULGU|nr:unnamed protein product [Gulo gulo]